MRDALEILHQRAPDLEADGEMQANTALSQAMRDLMLPSSRLKGEANVLIMPNLDAANIAYTMMMIMADALLVGPILHRRRQARPYPDAFGDGARHHQHDSGLGRPSARRWEALTRGPHVSPIQCPSLRPRGILTQSCGEAQTLPLCYCWNVIVNIPFWRHGGQGLRLMWRMDSNKVVLMAGGTNWARPGSSGRE